MSSQFYVVFQPGSTGVSEGNRGPSNEIRASHPSLEAALLGKDWPLKTGFIAVKITDGSGEILWERTAGQHVAANGSVW
jgi:hypothetical protein